jgi:hypothetical protein
LPHRDGNRPGALTAGERRQFLVSLTRARRIAARGLRDTRFHRPMGAGSQENCASRASLGKMLIQG